MRNIFVFLAFLTSLNVFSQVHITSEDLKAAIGSWEGTLTYLDYQTNKPFSMPANLIVEQGQNKNVLFLKNSYPNEPKANNSYKIKVTKNGTILNRHFVIAREELANGLLQIKAELKGKDNNKKALIRYVYLISTELFVIRKEVQFKEDGDWIKRSEFSYKKKDGKDLDRPKN